MATRNRKANRIGRTHVSAHESAEGLAITGLGPPDQNLVRCTFFFTHETPLPPAVLSTFEMPATPETHHPLGSLSEGADLARSRSSGNSSSESPSKELPGTSASPQATEGSATV